ncbi:MAG: tyrosine-type recombinase/integrase [Pseudobdellovibrio sp.]
MKAGIYKLSSGVFQVSYIDSDKKRVRHKFKSYRAAKIYADRVTNKRPMMLHVESSKTIAMLLQEYVEQNPASPIRKRSLELFESFKTYFGGIYCQDLNKVLCSHWLGQIKTEKQYSSRTMRVCKYLYSAFFQELVDKGLIEKNYMAEIYIKLGTRTKQRVFLSESELKEILNGLIKYNPNQTYPVIYFLIHTGCKISEALSLTWQDVDFEKKTVNFPRTDSSNARVLNLSPYILEFLKSHPRITDNVFINDQCEVWTASSFYKVMAVDRSSIDLNRHWDSFSFRHSFAYHFLKSGKTLQQLQVVLGHRQIAQTIQFYGDILTT